MEIQLRNVCKTIKDNIVLSDVNYTFVGGNIYGIKGKNGSGKTMLLRAIGGIMRITSGEIIINNKILGRDVEYPESMGMLIEHPAYLSYCSALDNLRILASLDHESKNCDLKGLLKAVELDPYDTKKVRRFSLGMKQKLGIAMALLNEPKLIILDEPINAIDEDGVESIRRIICDLKAKDRIIIVVCHDNDELKLFSDIILTMKDGKIVHEEKV